jgi:hypothetical protein
MWNVTMINQSPLWLIKVPSKLAKNARQMMDEFADYPMWIS